MNKSLHIPNRFQSLVESPDIRHYTEDERKRKTVVVNDGRFEREFVPAMRTAAFAHANARLERVKGYGVVDATAELLFDPHFRKQRNYGPTREIVQKKIATALERKEPIQFVALMFTRKNVCSLKRNGIDIGEPDLAELLSLFHLNAFMSTLASAYPHGVRFLILSEGKRFVDAFDLCPRRVSVYQEKLKSWIQKWGLEYLEVCDYEDFLSAALSIEAQEKRKQSYVQALGKYQTLMQEIWAPENMERTLANAIQRDPVTDMCNSRNTFIPLWDSIKHSIPYTSIREDAALRGIEYEAHYRNVFRNLLQIHADSSIERLRKEVLANSWQSAIEHNARIMADAHLDIAGLISSTAFRATINPKPNSAHIGIHSVRETTSRVQPWHGTALVGVDGVGTLRTTVLSKLEIESRNAIPVRVESHEESFFYATSDAVLRILSGEFAINMSTR